MKKDRSQHLEQLHVEMELRNYSPRTIATYGDLMSKVEKFFGQSIENISTRQFKDFLHHRITSDGISTSCVNQYISAFKILQADVLKRDWEEIKIKRPRRTKRLPVVLSVEEVEAIIRATGNIKHRALLMLAYSSGLRRQEARLIEPKAIDSGRMQVRVIQGKGKKDRYTILATKTLDTLRTYYKLERPSRYLFEAQGRKGKPLAENTLNLIVKKSAAKAGIKKDVTFHTLRHCFATHLLEKGINIRLIQQFLGHTSLKTTAGYLHLVNASPSCVTSPLDAMNLQDNPSWKTSPNA